MSIRALAVTFALLLVPAVARAQAPSPPSEEQVEAAKGLYREARELRKQGKTKEALERALEAYRTASTPVTALQVGNLLVEAGRLVEARDLVRGVTLLPVSPRESDKGRDARQDAASLAAALDARIPKIAFAERPRGADVAVDGKPLGTTDPAAWQGVDPGAHSIVVRAGERTCVAIQVTLAEGEARTIDLHDVASACHLEPATPSPTPETTPLPSPRPAPPVAPSPAEATPREDLSDHTWRWAGAGIAGAGVVVAGIGGYLALSAKNDYNAVAAQCPARGCTQDAFDARTSARSRADIATLPVLVGLAAIGGGAALFVLDPGGTTPSRTSVAVGAGNVRLTVRF